MNNANFDMVDDILKYYQDSGFDIYYESLDSSWSSFIDLISTREDEVRRTIYVGTSLKEMIAAMELYLEGNE